MPEQLAFNMDCLEAMREMPDKAFDLAVVDPPYGGGSYNGAIVGRFGGRFAGYYLGDSSQTVQVERERACAEARQNGNGVNEADSVDCSTVTISATRTGGTWSRKYQREPRRRRVQIFAIGMLRRRLNTLNSLQGYQRTK